MLRAPSHLLACRSDRGPRRRRPWPSLAAPWLAFAVLAPIGVSGCDRPATPPGGADASPAPEGGRAPAEGQSGLISSAALMQELHPGNAPNTAGILRSPGHRESTYDVSAPATVLVATTWGHGSGVVIDPRGWVLTNHHVIASGETLDFDIEVSVTVPKIDADGRASAGKKYRARAYKIDPNRDLALLKVTDAGDDEFAVAPLSERPPRPGSRVAAVGNAGVGFGWAIKHCNINAVGTMESAAQVIFADQHETLGADYKDQVSKAAKEAAKKAGTLIQTDCTVLPGDSGGPLIDEETHAVVGLNVAVKPWTEAGQQLGSVAFHIHLDELRSFVADIPDVAPSFIPDPWELGGAEGLTSDRDRDGEIDTLTLRGTCGAGQMCGAMFVDLDQDSFAKGKPDTIAEIYEARAFSPEFVIYQRGRMPRKVSTTSAPVPVRDEYFYFDSNGDGEMDGLIVADGELGEKRGYRISGGKLTPDPELGDTDGTLFASADTQQRFERYKLAFDTDGRTETDGKTTALEIVLGDHDGNGVVDTALVRTRLDQRVLIDVDEDSELERDLEARLASGDVDLEFMAIKTTPIKVFYDTNEDGAFDLLLEGSDHDPAVAQAAFTIAEGRKPEPAPMHIGRKLLRPGLAGPHATRLGKDLGALFHGRAVASDDGEGSFPAITTSAVSRVLPWDDKDTYLLAVEDVDRILVLADLDKDSYKKNPRGSTPDVTAAVREGSFDAEFAFIFDGTVSWAYYDTNADGHWDVINVSHGGDPMHAHFRFVRDPKSGEMLGAPVSALHDLIDPDEFKNARTRKRFKSVVDRVVDR